MTEPRRLQLPDCFSEPLQVAGNAAAQLLLPAQQAELQDGGSVLLDAGQSFRVVSNASVLNDGEHGLKASRKTLEQDPVDPQKLSWVGDRPRATPDEILDSYTDAFVLRREDPVAGTAGLRTPQVGAVHAALGYWTTGSTEPATVVMPTGTGKTETMVALLVAERLPRLLVVVPSDALRKQVAAKFERLGVLPVAGVVADSALRPVVGQIRHRFKTADEAKEFAAACNVMVTTPSALLGAQAQSLLDACSHLFVDEAHHVAAPTWRQIVDGFAPRPIVQFTATPYREDGKALGGRQIYRLPLKRAQELGYFSKIDYTSVVDFFAPHETLAQRAVTRLREDIDKNLDHLLMARVRSVARAEEILEIYRDIASDLEPVTVHSRMGVRERSEHLEGVRSGASRIVVCVDMLGEGFDLPQLKVAAIHDPHKSLGVTLQFVGRFARVAGANLGNAAVFVGPPERDYDERLRRLYAEDADWNVLIRELADETVAEEADLEAFEAGFGRPPDEVSLRSLAPKMSTVVYRTQCADWNPEGVLRVYPEDNLLSKPLPINREAHVTWFVVELRQPVRWGELPTVEEIAYHLFVIYWDDDHGLLYINSSDKSGVHENLAKAVAGPNVSLIKGTDVYRAMHNLQRLLPTNVGLLDVRNQNRRFTMLVGANVIEGLPTSETGTKAQTNIFASGFEFGDRITVGASLKGRIWSYAAARSLKHWTEWCDHVGRKVSDASISVESVMANFIRPEELEDRPALVLLAVEWPWNSWVGAGSARNLEYANEIHPILEAELRVTRLERDGPLEVQVDTASWQAPYRVEITKDGIRWVALAGEVQLVSVRGNTTPLSTYLEEAGTLLLFEDEAMVVPPALLLKPNREVSPVELDRLQVIDWSGIDLKKESQKREKRTDSIQYRMLEEVRAQRDWDLVIDDDSSGEVADIVCVAESGQDLDVLLVHCKFARQGQPTARVEDLYELCGQAQKSARWRHYVTEMFDRLIVREQRRVRKYDHSGLEVGEAADLYTLREKARRRRTQFTIALAQPGVAKSGVSQPQLHLLGSTHTYVNAVAAADFRVYCSA